VPRLIDVPSTAQYLSLSKRYIRSLVGRGVLRPVRVGRRLLFDVRDLDEVVDRWKCESSSAADSQLSAAALKGWQQTPVRKKKGAAA
jgi:excisionase family DNA binding protein